MSYLQSQRPVLSRKRKRCTSMNCSLALFDPAWSLLTILPFNYLHHQFLLSITSPHWFFSLSIIPMLATILLFWCLSTPFWNCEMSRNTFLNDMHNTLSDWETNPLSFGKNRKAWSSKSSENEVENLVSVSSFSVAFLFLVKALIF